MTPPITERTVELGDLRFALLESGPSDGPLALLLHGFPDTAWTWRHLLPALADAGYHAVAPALRGYAPSSCSPDGRYPIGALVNDVVELHDLLGGDERAGLVGHDWGAAIAYGAVGFAPERFRRVVTLAVPPTGAFVQGLLRYEQLKRSFYMFFFQTPFAEATVAEHDMEFIAKLWRDWSPGYDATEDLAHVRAALGSPENLSGAIGYYRAMFDFAGAPPEYAAQAAAALGPSPRPTLYLHGRDDGCVAAEVLELPEIDASVRAMLGEGSQVRIVDGVGHFLQLEDPTRVNAAIVDWLTAS